MLSFVRDLWLQAGSPTDVIPWLVLGNMLFAMAVALFIWRNVRNLVERLKTFLDGGGLGVVNAAALSVVSADGKAHELVCPIWNEKEDGQLNARQFQLLFNAARRAREMGLELIFGREVRVRRLLGKGSPRDQTWHKMQLGRFAYDLRCQLEGHSNS